MNCTRNAGGFSAWNYLTLPVSTSSEAGQPGPANSRFVVEAQFYEKLAGGKIRCRLCPRLCIVADRERGHCGVRENREGRFFTLVHSRVCAAHIDPIEKKPMFHYLPGTTALSIATAGCNVNCQFCQNWEISQLRPEQVSADYAPPGQIAELARQNRCPTIAFTYTEPTVFSEYMMDAADAGHAAGVRSIAVSNGYIQPVAAGEIYAKLDAVKIDLKAFNNGFYAKVVNGRLKPVLDTLVQLSRMGKWFEIVYMIVPTLNDKEAELRGLVRWIKTHLGADVPLHFTQFHPDYRLQNLPITPVATLENARTMARSEGLHFVYIGNVPGHPAQNTYCPQCGKLLVERVGFTASSALIGRNGTCPGCRHPIPGIWHM